MLDRFVYLFALAATTVLRSLPLGFCFGMGRALGALLWLILPGYRKLARENIAYAFSDTLSPREVRRTVFLNFLNMGANALSAIKMSAMSEAEISRVAHFENKQGMLDAISRGRGVVMCISHIGNWELNAQLVYHVRPAKTGTVYQSLRNRQLDALLTRDRQRLGVQTFDRKKGFNGAMTLLREGGMLGILVDQHAGDSGLWTPLFNRLCSTSPLAATLAVRTGATVLSAAIYTEGFARWKVVISEEIPYQPENSDQLTADINRVLEAQIRKSPADWFWVHNRWKTPLPYFLASGAKRGIHLPPKTDVSSLKRFPMLVRSSNWLGDAVMSVPAVRAFKLGRPDAHLTILAPAKLAALWRQVKEVDEVISFERSESVFSVSRKIRNRFDVAILLPNSLRSALEVWLAGIPRRVGYRGHYRSKLLNQIISDSKSLIPKHHVDRYWRIAERCGAEDSRPHSEPAWKSSLASDVIGICPGAEYGSAKRWPAEKFREVMEKVATTRSCSWKILGTAADTPVAEEIQKGPTGNVIDLTGKTSLDELIKELLSLRLLITNDTGTMHLADMLGVPLIAIFGSTEPRLTGPRSTRSQVVRHQVECSPCFLRECPLDFRCMQAVTSAEISQKILTELSTV